MSPDGDSTADFLLEQQITATGAGNGSGPDCRTSATAENPIGYLSDGVTESGLTLLFHVGVCLRGFDADAPVTLSVDVAGQTYETLVYLSTELVDYNTAVAARQALFDGAPLQARLLSGTDTFQTESWEFVPPPDVIDGLADAGQLIVAARQNSLSSIIIQPVEFLSGPQQAWLDSPGEFAIWGFGAGRRVPIGLYFRDDPAGDTYTLVERLGIVTMPASDLAVFAVPDDVMRQFAGDENYCVSAPVRPVYNCTFASAEA